MRLSFRFAAAALVIGTLACVRPVMASDQRTFARPIDDRIMAEVTPRLHNARYLGRVSPTRMLDLNIHLKYPHPEAVRQFADMVNDYRSPMYGHWLKPNQFVAAFAPSVAEYNGVARELAANGIKTWRTWPDRKMLKVRASVATIERYFHTRMARVYVEGREHFANVAPAVVPGNMHGMMMAVVGLDDFEMHNHLIPNFKRFGKEMSARKRGVVVPMPVPTLPVPAPLVPPGINPLDMQTAYNYPIHNDATADGRGVTIAIEAAYGINDADINYFWSAFNVTRTGTLNIIDPEANAPPTFDPTDSAEVTVDIEQSTSNAPGANEKVYTVPAALTLMLEDTYHSVVADPSVDVVSTSFGNCESNNSFSALSADDDTFEQGSIEGQTMFSAAGDDGSSDCRANGPDSVDFPGSSIEVGSAGGTTLNLNADMTIASEPSWSCLPSAGTTGGTDACDNGAGGGGVSTVFPLPAWQKGLAAAAASGTRVSATMRNVPDISLNADVNTSYAVFFTGTADLGYGGTSLVGPNLAAIYAQIESKTHQRMGRSSTSLYYAYASKINPYTTGIYHDVTVGDNLDGAYTGGTGFMSATGFDDASGWGSLNATQFMKSLPVPAGAPNI